MFSCMLKPLQTVEKAMTHVRKQAAMIYTYIEIGVAQGHTTKALATELFNHGRARMSQRHRALIAAAGPPCGM